MPNLEIDKIYQSKKEMIEYQEASKEIKPIIFIEELLSIIEETLVRLKIREKELIAWNNLFGFFDTLTTKDKDNFDLAINRGSLFEKKAK